MSLAGCLGLQSCVGPDFQLPKVPEIAAFTAERLPARQHGTAEKRSGSKSATTLPADWWALFPLDRTQRGCRARASRQSERRCRAGRAARGAGERLCGGGTALSAGDGQLSRSRAEGSPNRCPRRLPVRWANFYTLHTAQFSVSYVPDVWGGTRRQIESLDALKENQRFVNEATFLTLTSSIALGAIQEASLRAQIARDRALDQNCQGHPRQS